jgi:hypothetical protein
MKVYIGKNRNHWISPYIICEKICWWREIDYDEPWVKNANLFLEPVMKIVQKIWDFVHPPINYIKIDYYDTWSMDSTLSPIILPMLKQLKVTKHGAPYVDDEDVPPTLRSKRKIGDDVDSKFFKRFDYVLDEMIWTFEQLCNWNHDAKFYTHMTKTVDWDKDINKSIRDIKVDRVGLKKHEQRIDNGLRLFGKYFRSLWD